MILIIVHHHFRPGGVRRVIELATPHIIAHCPERVRSVVLASGEAPEAAWLKALGESIPGTPVRVIVQPSFGYVSELAQAGPELRRRVCEGVSALLMEMGRDTCLIWAHNLGLGRNIHLSSELTFTCHCAGIPLIAHHHDWWFENRWHHFAGMRVPGFRKLDAVAEAVLRDSPNVRHAAINQADAAVLTRHFPGRSGWLPNPMEKMPPPPAARIDAAKSWLRQQTGADAPVWLMPCRLLRRKNIGEALLLTRWLRPEAWLVTTGGVSSAEEQAHADTLNEGARTHGWRLRLGILQSADDRAPSVPELVAASEAILLTSLQEGFGLSYLEAAAMNRPLLARKLPNIAPDLTKFGFSFPQSYKELLVDPSLFDWQGECQRQKRLQAEWKGLMPSAAATLVGKPVLLAGGTEPFPVPFSRLTLTAQLEVLAQPIEHSWKRCEPHNPFLKRWRDRAADGQLQTSLWPRSAARWVGGRAYAQRFLDLVADWPFPAPRPGASKAAQAEFLRKRLGRDYLYPLLWNSRT